MTRSNEALLPSSGDAEKDVLRYIIDGGVLQDVTNMIAPDQLSHRAHQIVFKAMISMEKAGLSIDLAALVSWLSNKGKLNQIGGKEFLIDLAYGFDSQIVGDLSNACREIISTSCKRKLIEVHHQSQQALQAGKVLEHDKLFRIIEQAQNDLMRSISGAEVEVTRSSLADIGAVLGNTRWLFPCVVPYGYLTLIAAVSKGMKTMFSLHITDIAIRGGLRWPDGSPGPAEPGYAVWCESEGRMGANFERCVNFNIPTDRIIMPLEDKLKPFRIDDPGHMAQLRLTVKTYKPQVIVLDSLAASHGLQENDPRVAKLLADFQEIVQDAKCAGLVIHHVRKAGKDGRVEISLDDVRGSTAIPAACVSIIGIDRPNPTSLKRRVQIIAGNLTASYPSFGMEWVKEDGRDTLAFDRNPPGTPEKMTAGNAAQIALNAFLSDGKAHDKADVLKALEKEHNKKAIERAASTLEQTGRMLRWQGIDHRAWWKAKPEEEDR